MGAESGLPFGAAGLRFIVTSTILGAFAGVLIDLLEVDDGRVGTAVFLTATGEHSLVRFSAVAARRAARSRWKCLYLEALWGLFTVITTSGMLANRSGGHGRVFIPLCVGGNARGSDGRGSPVPFPASDSGAGGSGWIGRLHGVLDFHPDHISSA